MFQSQSKLISASNKIRSLVIKYKLPIAVLLISLVGLYLRFWKIEESLLFTWDQGRDAWASWDILHGKFPLKGPRTGIGDFYLGPVYFYLLAPFYYIARMDPMGANYFNITANILTLPTIFLVAKKIFNTKTALIALIIFAVNNHAIVSTKTPWNVTLIPLISTLIIFCVWQILGGKYKYTAILALLCGFFFHIHFTAVFLPLILAPTVFFVKKKKKLIKWALISSPLFFIWFIPTIVDDLKNYHYNFYRFRDFLTSYAMPPHLQFILYRAQEAFIQISTTVSYKQVDFLKFIVLPVFFATVMLWEKNTDVKKFSTLLLLWFLVPLFGFSMYKGHIPDYYYLLNLTAAIFTIAYLTEKLLAAKNIFLTLAIAIFAIFYIYTNTRLHIGKTEVENLKTQKAKAAQKIKNGQILDYKEGDIESYLYAVWREKTK